MRERRNRAIVPSGTLELVVNLHEDALRIYDPREQGVAAASGAVVSGRLSAVLRDRRA